MKQKIVVETKMKTIPKCCHDCRFYDSQSYYPGSGNWNRNDGVCMALADSKGVCPSTSLIIVARQRLKKCPLKAIEVEDKQC